MLAPKLLTFSGLVRLAIAAPPNFPKSGNGLWYNTPGTSWVTDYLPVGNGYLAAMTPGDTSHEATQLNIESLWSGGPFADPTYNGGNHDQQSQAGLAEDMQNIRKTIFESTTGEIDNIDVLSSPSDGYGSYAGAGYLLTTLATTGDVSNYSRWLDLDQAVAYTSWSQSNVTFIRDTFCSHPAKACIQHLSTNNPTTMPQITYAFSSLLEDGLPTPNITCLDNATLVVRGLVSEPGMMYEIIGRAQAISSNELASIQCQPTPNSANGAPNATITVAGASAAWLSWVGGTNFDLDAGDISHSFTFQGPDPHSALLGDLEVVTSPRLSYNSILSAHTIDFAAAMSPFALSLGQSPDLSVPTDQLVGSYETDVGNAYLEWLLFNFGRYMLASSTRGILPANLQGKWGNSISNAWSADYHSNINIQMNYWIAEMTGMDVTDSLFNYFEKNWAPRGAETAQVLYNISRGWVTHNEMNIFGHTGMKSGGASWADYPESAVWMMIHVWDHFDFTNDVTWWRTQGWPLVKGVASFHLDKLILDLHFNDSTLVVSPCNSPEQQPITFACAHAQQLIWQLFNTIEKGFEAAGDTDTAFLQEVIEKRSQMDKGIRIGSWDQLQEWKMDMDQPTDMHRHLSHLIGLYPGYALSSYDASLQGGLVVNGAHLNYTKKQVLDAAEVSLIHRGNGTAPDGNAGWEKVWRAACWAQLGNATAFYHQLTYAVTTNFGPNLFSLYNPFIVGDTSNIFQIDANLGFPAAVLNALLQAPDVPNLQTTLTVTLLPALPQKWSSGYITGARIRAGIAVNLHWSEGKLTGAEFLADDTATSRRFVVVYLGSVVSEFTAMAGTTKVLKFA